jgi:hypothetical protein
MNRLMMTIRDRMTGQWISQVLRASGVPRAVDPAKVKCIESFESQSLGRLLNFEAGVSSSPLKKVSDRQSVSIRGGGTVCFNVLSHSPPDIRLSEAP